MLHLGRVWMVSPSVLVLVLLAACQSMQSNDRPLIDTLTEVSSAQQHDALEDERPPAPTPLPTSEIIHPQATSGNYGWSVALDGDQAIVGARNNTGSAHVLTRENSSSSWTEQAMLTASDGQLSDHFGKSVALLGNLALVGSPDADWDDLRNPGAAYLFQWDDSDSEWSEIAKLTNIATPNAYLGTSVALTKDAAIAGAPGIGQVAVFTLSRSSDEWRVQAELKGSDASSLVFGATIAVFGNRMLVGAPVDTSLPNAPETGKVYLFERNQDGSWHEAHTFEENDPMFGSAVALDGGTIVIGGNNMVFVYEHARDGSWPLVTTLTDEDPNTNFGSTVAVQTGTTLIGAYRLTHGENGENGVVRAYRRHFNGTWLYWKLLLPQPPTSIPAPFSATNYFGFSVAMDGTTAFVGVPGDDVQGANAGSGHSFDLNRCGWDIYPHCCGRMNLAPEKLTPEQRRHFPENRL